jgi:hypothetical protein
METTLKCTVTIFDALGESYTILSASRHYICTRQYNICEANILPLDYRLTSIPQRQQQKGCNKPCNSLPPRAPLNKYHWFLQHRKQYWHWVICPKLQRFASLVTSIALRIPRPTSRRPSPILPIRHWHKAARSLLFRWEHHGKPWLHARTLHTHKPWAYVLL